MRTPTGSPSGSPTRQRGVLSSIVAPSDSALLIKPSGPSSPRSGAPSRRTVTSHAESTMTNAEWKGMHQASLFSCIANLTNSIVGAGILGLPHGLRDCGYALGVGIMVVCCVLSSFSLHLLAQCAHFFHLKRQPSSFYAVALEAIPKWALITDFAVVVNCFGNGATYLIVIADQMPKVMDFLGAGSTAQNRRLWVLVAFAIVSPLSALPKLDSLRFTSTASMVFIAFVTVMVVLYAIAPDGMDPCEKVPVGTNCTGETVLVNEHSDALKAITVFIFCFVCHQNIFSICNEIRDPTPRRYDAAVFSAQGLALCVYITVAVAAYYTYGDIIDADMLKTYPVVTVVSIARFCISLLVAFAYPLQAHPARRSALSMWEQIAAWSEERTEREKLNSAEDEEAVLTDHHELSASTRVVRYWTTTSLFLGLTVAVAMVVSDLGVALAVTGGTASTLVCYIVPGICYYQIYSTPHLKRSLAFALFIIGCLIVPSSLCITFLL
eukprot:TRINITY_DN12001_c0_g2_i1.p2 TRINITY_DN12001_c0_g2~~TRINITY_DN12001_c0_g2_i1.p2  ORF type:complete len:494 (+),score=144.31 TRINITY_DN12001_c0_g2_i1:107-1588(+)